MNTCKSFGSSLRLGKLLLALSVISSTILICLFECEERPEDAKLRVVLNLLLENDVFIVAERMEIKFCLKNIGICWK